MFVKARTHGLPAAAGAVPDAAGALRHPRETSCDQLPCTRDAWRQGADSMGNLRLKYTTNMYHLVI